MGRWGRVGLHRTVLEFYGLLKKDEHWPLFLVISSGYFLVAMRRENRANGGCIITYYLLA